MGHSQSRKRSSREGEREEEEEEVKPWDTQPIPAPVSGPWGLYITRSDLAKLIAGFRPDSMDDKWVVESDVPDRNGNIAVHFYRSWTGNEQFWIEVAPEGHSGDGVAEVTEITWDRRFGQESAINLVTSVCIHVLGCEWEE